MLDKNSSHHYRGRLKDSQLTKKILTTRTGTADHQNDDDQKEKETAH